MDSSISVIEEIKSRVLVSIFQQLGWTHSLGARNVYRNLSPAQHANLAQYATQLKAYMDQQGDTPADPVLLEIACLIPGTMRGKPSFMADQSPLSRPMYASELREGRDWLLRVESLAYAVRTITSGQTQILFSDIAPALNKIDSSDSTSNILLSVLDTVVLDDTSADSTRFDISLCKNWEQLNAQQARELASFVLTLSQLPLTAAGDTADELLLYIACLLPDALKGRYYELASRHIFSYSGVLYNGADPATSELLINHLDSSAISDDDLNAALTALAWIGDLNVQAAFQRWNIQPPPWRDQLYVPPSDYAKDAGWELTDSGERHNLTFAPCYRLLPADQGNDPVSVLTPNPAKCGYCNRNLITLLDLDLSGPRLSFLGITGKRLRIATCDRCGVYANSFLTEIDLEGKSEWSNLNEAISTGLDGESYYSAAPRTLVLADQPFNPLAAIACDISQLGGYPAWVQDASYPACGKCGQTMLFLGQLSTSDFMGEFSDGTTFCLVCPRYHMAATVYQQT